MQPASIREPANFGKRKEPHKIIVSSHGRTRQLHIHPVVFSAIVGTVFMFLVGYFGATAYLIFRDDLINASFANQARIQHEYEDRIAMLRSKLDRITSRQLLDQQAIENQVKELMSRQQQIGGRGERMQKLMEKASLSGLSARPATGRVPIPSLNPVKNEGSQNAQAKEELDTITTGSIKQGSMTSVQTSKPYKLSTSFTQELFGELAQAISEIDANQRYEVDSMRIAAAERSQKIGKALKSIGMMPREDDTSAVGGPFVPIDHSTDFSTRLDALEKNLAEYEKMSTIARKLPLGNPVPNAKVSSRYGTRKDPFNGRLAMHSGIDFKAPRGTPVKATGKGKVVKAGRMGGYGKVVEVRHSNGFITRYAHLSRIKVRVGQHVELGQMIGKVGSTGRSTGPHLHYEVRKDKKARNPAKYMKAGSRVKGLL